MIILIQSFSIYIYIHLIAPLSVLMPLCLYAYLSDCQMTTSMFICLTVSHFVCLSVFLSVCMNICLFFSLYVYLYFHLPIWIFV